MIEFARTRIPILDTLLLRQREADFLQHSTPSGANFFWLARYVYKHNLSQQFSDQGYTLNARRYTEYWSTTDGSFQTSNGAVKLAVIHPGKIEGLGVSAIFQWSKDTKESENCISSYICAVDLSKPDGQRRIGDLSSDRILKTPRGSQELRIEHIFLDGNDDDFGLSTGVLTPTSEMVREVTASSFFVIHEFLHNGHLPKQGTLLALSE